MLGTNPIDEVANLPEMTLSIESMNLENLATRTGLSRYLLKPQNIRRWEKL